MMRSFFFLLFLCLFGWGHTTAEVDPESQEALTAPNLFLKVFPASDSRDVKPLMENPGYTPKIYLSTSPGGFATRARFFALAREALNDSKLVEARVLLPQWAVWWSKLKDVTLMDASQDAPQFVAYLVSRIDGRVPDTDDIIEFEKSLDEQYLEVLAKQGEKSTRNRQESVAKV